MGLILSSPEPTASLTWARSCNTSLRSLPPNEAEANPVSRKPATAAGAEEDAGARRANGKRKQGWIRTPWSPRSPTWPSATLSPPPPATTRRWLTRPPLPQCPSAALCGRPWLRCDPSGTFRSLPRRCLAAPVSWISWYRCARMPWWMVIRPWFLIANGSWPRSRIALDCSARRGEACVFVSGSIFRLLVEEWIVMHRCHLWGGNGMGSIHSGIFWVSWIELGHGSYQ
jgi:hypothetical protein